MSDGWVMHETMLEFFDAQGFGYTTKRPLDIQYKAGLYETLSKADPDDYLFWLCVLSRAANQIESRAAVATDRHRYNDRRFKFEAFKTMTEKFVHECADIYKTVEVEPSLCARSHIV
jgi:hypothetical protein